MQRVMGLALVQLRVTTVCFCLPQFFFLMRLMLYLVWRRSAFCQRASCSYHYGERYCISSSLQPLFLFFFFCKHACLPFVLTLDKCCGTHYII